MSTGTVECHNCTVFLYAPTEAEAIAAWNRRLASQPTSAEDAWRPIETAPKDGSWVLIYAPDIEQGVTMGCYYREVARHPETGRFIGGEWTGAEWDGVVSGYLHPTHWMPLPAAPGTASRPTPDTQTAAIGAEAPWHGERPEKICEAIAQFWSEWEEERAGAGVYLLDELAEDAGEFANDLFDHLAALSQPQSEAGEEERKFYRSEWSTARLLEARNGGLLTDDGEAWRYRYTHKDVRGEYDVLYRPTRKIAAFTTTPQAHKMREALEIAAIRLYHCAQMIADGFQASGTLRVQRAMKAKVYAAEAFAALSEGDEG